MCFNKQMVKDAESEIKKLQGIIIIIIIITIIIIIIIYLLFI